MQKNIKNLHLSVNPPHGSVSVSAPISVSSLAIERFVRTRLSWIKRQRAKYLNQARQSQRQYVTGETFYLWGKTYYLRLENAYKNELILQQGNAILRVREQSTAVQRENFVREWYREELKAQIINKLAYWEEVTGLKASSWQTKYMTTKWGSCNPTKAKLWFNVQLAKKTPLCLDYVILHELLHLVEKAHNAHFVALMDKYMPLWREIKFTLNEQILDYM